METMRKSADVFITEFSSQIADLIPHDFISKKQATYLTKRKETLGQDEFIVISDFAENFSFVVQVRTNILNGSYYEINKTIVDLLFIGRCSRMALVQCTVYHTPLCNIFQRRT